MSEYLYFDIETVPDESRFPVSIPMPAVEQSPPFPAADAPAKSVDEIKRAIGGRLFPSAWVADAIAAETAGKSRTTAIAELRKADPSAAEQSAESDAAERIKLGSTTPEFCRSVSIAWATEGKVWPCCCGENEDDETSIIREFFSYAQAAQKLIGFNCIAFDLPVLFVRAAMLGLALPKLNLDLRPVGSRNVIDLYTARFGSRGNTSKDRPGGLKALCDAYGLTGDLFNGSSLSNGGDVFQNWKNGNIESIRRYNVIDVELIRRLHNFYAGYFC